MSGFLGRKLAAAGLLAALAAPAVAQTTTPTGQRTTGTTTGTATGTRTGTTATTPTTTTGTSTTPTTTQSGTTANGTAPTQLTGQWLEIAMLAESLKAELNLSFDNPWEDLFFFLIVAELYFEMNGQLGTQPGGVGTGTSTQPAATPPATGGLGTGGFGTGGWQQQPTGTTNRR